MKNNISMINKYKSRPRQVYKMSTKLWIRTTPNPVIFYGSGSGFVKSLDSDIKEFKDLIFFFVYTENNQKRIFSFKKNHY